MDGMKSCLVMDDTSLEIQTVQVASPVIVARCTSEPAAWIPSPTAEALVRNEYGSRLSGESLCFGVRATGGFPDMLSESDIDFDITLVGNKGRFIYNLLLEANNCS